MISHLDSSGDLWQLRRSFGQIGKSAPCCLFCTSVHAGARARCGDYILNWALRSSKNRAEFEQVREHQQPLFSFQFRFEPALGRAINLAVGEEYVEWVGGNRLQITPKGQRWVKDILKDKSVMQQEREFLERIGKDITEGIATEMITVKIV